MQNTYNSLKGFNFIELIVVISVVAILASIAVPSYLNYTRRAYYKEMLSVLTPYKNSITSCYQKTNKLQGCNGGTHKILPNITKPTNSITSLTISNGIITVVPIKHDGVKPEDIYILTPSIVGKTVTWMPSGPAISKGYVD